MKNLKQFTNDLIKSFPSKTTISLGLKKQDNIDKLWYQERDDRDFLQITQKNAKDIAEAMVKQYVKGDIVGKPSETLLKALEAGGLRYKKIVLNRFGTGSKDVPLKPLSREYIKQKGNSKIGYNTGDLYRDIKQAKVIVKLKDK